MTLNYTTYIAQTSNLMVIGSTDPNFITMAPGMIDYAEQRIYRELDPLRVQVTDSTKLVSSGNRSITLSTANGVYITVDQINIITPSSLTAATGTRNAVTAVDRSFLDAVYPSNTAATDIPQFYAMASDTEVLLGPAPDAAYPIEVVGIQRPTPLSSANSSTYLTQYCPDLFIAASMVFGFGYMRDFGGQTDNPQATQSWENQYQLLFKSAKEEMARSKHESQGWTPSSPSPIATPSRV